MRRLLAALLLLPLGVVGCAHSTYERLPDGTVRAEAYALGQASAAVTPKGSLSVQGGPLSDVFRLLVVSVASIVSPYLGGAVVAAGAVADATTPTKHAPAPPADPEDPPR